ncbi:hypothetical protein PYCCODRAFT_1404696 [Trametes coccinea BRFM310]|uniref:DUF659 domain-containing protein n=1 Tax=Trametes coccinea (strain BRFM310) TaxID=1353009 RepID=A0A1Y2IZ51_TRAC3|nr:hypothetical protein PYCCODRAFT_1404696 [Trametes coccinea BRFM310]
MCNIPWNAAENPQLEAFFEKWVPGAQVPGRRQLSGKHLQEAVKTVRSSTRAAVQGKYATGQSDGWKNIAKTSVITSMMSVDREVHLVRTHDMTGLPKTGQEHVEIIKKDMTLMRDVYDVCPIAWVTDDGPDGKGARNLLRKLLPWLVTLVCWGHQTSLLAGDYLTISDYKETVEASLDIIRWFNNHSSALDLFNQEQVLTYQARVQERHFSGLLSERPLALILPAKTRWTSNFQSASRLLAVARALKTCVLRHKELLVDIGRRSQTANAQETARKVITTVEDKSFWSRLERVEAHLRPLAVATNILQARHTRMDHVLLTLGNLYRIYNTDDVEYDVKERMLSRLELRWKKGAGQEQDLFILAVFLNPYIRGYCFDREALPPSEVYGMATRAFLRFFGTTPNAEFTDALVDYSQNTREFTDDAMGLAAKERSAQDRGEDIDIVELWSRIDRSNDTLAVCLGRNGIVKLAIRLLSIVANSAGVECAFSDFGRTHTKGRNRLNPEIVHNTGMLRMAIRREHAAAGRLPRRLKRKLGADYEPLNSDVHHPGASGHCGATGSYVGDEELDDEITDSLGELVQAAIDSSEPSSDSDDDADDSNDVGGNLSSREGQAAPSGSSPSLTSAPTASPSQSAPAPLESSSTTPTSGGPLMLTAETLSAVNANPANSQDHRRRTTKPKPVQIPLGISFTSTGAVFESVEGSGAAPAVRFHLDWRYTGLPDGNLSLFYSACFQS